MPQAPSDYPPQIEDTARAAATRRAQVKIELLRHALVYGIVIGALAILNLATSPSYLWFLWPAIGWGVGLFLHALNVFVFTDRLAQRMADRELRRSERAP